MFDDLMDYFSGTTGVYGTSPGLTYSPDAPAFQPGNYASLNMGDDPLSLAEYRNRASFNFNQPSALAGSTTPGDEFTGKGLLFNNRPEDGLYAAPADIRSPTIEELAKGASNIPDQLGSNEPNKNPTKKPDPALMMAAAGMFNQGRPAQPQAPQLPHDSWAAQSKTGSFAQMAPYAHGVQMHHSQAIKEALRRKMIEGQQGLLE